MIHNYEVLLWAGLVAFFLGLARAVPFIFDEPPPTKRETWGAILRVICNTPLAMVFAHTLGRPVAATLNGWVAKFGIHDLIIDPVAAGSFIAIFTVLFLHVAVEVVSRGISARLKDAIGGF